MLHNSRSNRNAANDSDPLGNMTWGVLCDRRRPSRFRVVISRMVNGNVLLEHTSCGLHAFSKVVLLSAACFLRPYPARMKLTYCPFKRTVSRHTGTHLVSHFVQVVFTRYDYNEKVLIVSLCCNIKISGSLKNAWRRKPCPRDVAFCLILFRVCASGVTTGK